MTDTLKELGKALVCIAVMKQLYELAATTTDTPGLEELHKRLLELADELKAELHEVATLREVR